MTPSPHNEPLEQLANALNQRGLATPARILLDILAPLGFIAGQITLFARPFVPGDRWARYIDALSDRQGWEQLRDILNRDC
ncbi:MULTISPECIES: hypothetical protein [Roseiflexus]|jgi:hypothetical protein|uniref:Uncharacterized protein n=1 Tax=Roseiflexus castenholzii (strain DSM 13941 / HLO8) TaxID=383372 RepID=A7NLC2_ROSCS|nr:MULTISPECIES: hypothetical protein [Roseiflexus]ABU58305.1 conserved hypothetical protein [Roseiflexus castenholzii DSM 13941]PJF24079.1 MAG: hypothetical protein CUN53_19635 [Phototrophicales bacterium]PMP73292.1 MAG: hypothetical protein C0183_23115 [Roseiflexus castenholzii]GIW01248.1 MAG: hypothetical protein KatS3mg058_2651 [Roseiflexus sp.]